jgi:predicted alpha/beta superfamily hydrolase
MRFDLSLAAWLAMFAAVFTGLFSGCARTPVVRAKPSTAAEPARQPINIGGRSTLHSKILNEERPYLLHLPQSYASKVFAPKRYPVLYLLDGDKHFQSASGVVQFMSAGINGNIQIPELIIVAIPNTARNRDLTPTHSLRWSDGKESPSLVSSGGGVAFQRFLKEELIPHIENQYRTIPYRLLVGHSLGGLLALDAFLRQDAVFQAYIAMDPSVWWDDRFLLRKAKDVLPEANDLRDSVYISVANNPHIDPAVGDNPRREFAAMLQSNRSPRFRSRLQYFEAEDHGSVPLISLYQGLLFIFDGYKPSIGAVFENPSSIKAHFAKVSERLGVELLPPEEFLQIVGVELLYQKRRAEGAIECFQINVENYPDSFNAYHCLAEAYAVKGEKALAIKNYEKSINLNPNNRSAREAVEKLKRP